MMHKRTETVDEWYELTAQSLKCRNRFENSCEGRLDISNCTSLLFWIFQTFFHPKKIKSRSIAGTDFNIIWIYWHTEASSARTGPPAPHQNILNTKWSLSNFGTLQKDGFYSSRTWWKVELRFPQEEVFFSELRCYNNCQAILTPPLSIFSFIFLDIFLDNSKFPGFLSSCFYAQIRKAQHKSLMEALLLRAGRKQSESWPSWSSHQKK